MEYSKRGLLNYSKSAKWADTDIYFTVKPTAPRTSVHSTSIAVNYAV